MWTSENGKKPLFRNPVFLASLAAVVFAVLLSSVMLISYVSDSRKLKDTKSQYEDVRKEYKIIAEKNDPSVKNKKELSNNEIKRNLAGTSEDEELEIRVGKPSYDNDIANRLLQIEALQGNQPADTADGGQSP